MATKKTSEKSIEVTWKPSVLRFTAFFYDKWEADQSWWHEVIGMKSDNSNRTGLETRDEGTFSGDKLLLSVNALRVDWRIVVQKEVSETFQFNTLGPLEENLNALSDIVIKWLKLASLPKINRIAFGATLLQPVYTLREGYEVLRPFLPSVSIDAENSSDLLYQINRPTISKSGVSNLGINRLSKWAVLRLNAALVSGNNAATVELPKSFASHVELDINTQVYDGELPKAKLPKIFKELIKLGQEIAEHGDIK